MNVPKLAVMRVLWCGTSGYRTSPPLTFAPKGLKLLFLISRKLKENWVVSDVKYLVADLSTENLVRFLLNNLLMVFWTSELKKQYKSDIDIPWKKYILTLQNYRRIWDLGWLEDGVDQHVDVLVLGSLHDLRVDEEEKVGDAQQWEEDQCWLDCFADLENNWKIFIPSLQPEVRKVFEGILITKEWRK